MGFKNRRLEYTRLKNNGLNGRIPDLSQDDGSLELEFGTPKEIMVKSKGKVKK